MSRGYGVGVRIVGLTVLVAAGLSFAVARSEPRTIPAGEDLESVAFPIGPFKLTERSGRPITESDLADRVWIASFIFTRCPLSCPRITTLMKDLQARLQGSSPVQLVSISVDPEFDTPEVLRAYADKFGADPTRWWFLTGEPGVVAALIEKQFKLSIASSTPEERQAGAEAIMHSDRLALVDRGRLVGLFDSNDPEAVDRLVAGARRRGRPAWLAALPALNATLNGICSILLVAGWLQIRNRPAEPGVALLDQQRVHRHRLFMLAAVAVSAAFLCSYSIYHFLAGSTPFRGRGWIRPFYFTTLFSHTILATFGVAPLVGLTLYRAFRRDFVGHARIARVAFPIWLYVSITGVMIYLMLYQLPAAAIAPAAGN